MRCESRVAKIHRVEILTKLRTIDAGDTEIFEVLGYDSEGNAFSTLEGVRFRWSISAGAENLKILSLKVRNDFSMENNMLIGFSHQDH